MDTRVKYMNILQRFKQEHGSEYGITRIGIFGSVARGEYTDESDRVEKEVIYVWQNAGNRWTALYAYIF